MTNTEKRPTPRDVMASTSKLYTFMSDAYIAQERAELRAQWEREDRIAALPRITESKAYRKAAGR
jgi:hypothetical protein